MESTGRKERTLMSFIQKVGLKLGINYVNKNYINPYFGMKRKKRFGETTVGKVLGGALGLINPALGDIVSGKGDVGDLIQNIKNAQVPEEHKLRAQELVLEAYEAEVHDRVAARQREAAVAQAGGSDIMFKVVGTSVLGIWAFLLYALFFGDLQFEDNVEDLMQIAFGAVSSQVMSIVSYYYGSSIGSKQKSVFIDAANNANSN